MPSEVLKIGVLALQGGFAKHLEMVRSLSVNAIEVKTASQLALCSGLILPGGESTTIYKLMEERSLIEPLISFAQERPLFGTCAGSILMARLNILSISVQRNAYGRQIHSFVGKIPFQGTEIDAPFIRAPKIETMGSEVKVLAYYNNFPVLVQEGQHLAATFHPELTSNHLVHSYFLDMCRK